MRLIFSDAYASPSFDPDRMFHVLRASDFSCYPLQRLGERLHRDRGNDFAFVLETQSGLGDPQVSSHWASSVLHVEMRIPLSYIRDHQQTCGSPFGGQACHQ